MKLQLALDFIDINDTITLLGYVSDVIDIVEIGTPFIIQEGIKPVAEVKKRFPSLQVLADLKIMDAGEHEARIAFEAGADIVTVLGAADDATIRGTVKEARKFGKKVMADMIAVADIRGRAAEIDLTGVDFICVHTAFDVQGQGRNPLDELEVLNEVVKNAKTAVAGGVNIETLRDIIPYRPEVIVVGGAITGKQDKRKAASDMKQLLK